MEHLDYCSRYQNKKKYIKRKESITLNDFNQL